MKKSKVKSVIFRVSVLALTLVIVFVLPLAHLSSGDDLEYIYSTFIGKKSGYNGVLEVWNIDTFESGTASKSSFLEMMGKEFQKKYKGVYVIVRNLSIGECQNLLLSGELPDIISCSYGVSDKIKDKIRPFGKVGQNIYSNFLNTGKMNEKVYGLPWCFGVYSLISTKAKLEKAGKFNDEVKLNEIAYESGYEYKSGKKMKKSVSLTYGTGEFLLPKNALNAYNRAGSTQPENSESVLTYKSQYSAYSSFLSNSATILLGTNRDICRMMNRENKGKVSDVLYQPLTTWTDLVQFAFLCNNGEELRKQYAEKYALFLTEEANQKRIEQIGMFPVTQVNESQYKGIMLDIILENFSNCSVKQVF